MADFQWVVVGAGFTGAVIAERLASQLGQRVLVIDRRPHIAGNAYDFRNASVLLIHRYGPHAFHTNSDKVWHYLSKFTSWRPYAHRVMASVADQLVPLPFNLNAIDQVFPRPVAEDLSQRLIAAFGLGARVPIMKLRAERDDALQMLAAFIYDNVFRGYTQKQWGLDPEALDPAVTARVPVHVSRDNRYFQDRFQGLPADGYTALFGRLLSHRNITVQLDTSYQTAATEVRGAKLVFTGPIDEYFDHRFGELPYRSLAFRFQDYPGDAVQPVGQVNYPNDFAFTRTTEFKYLTGEVAPLTTVAEEYPEPYRHGTNEPYYPIPTRENAERLRPYSAAAGELAGKVFFAGRLGDYAYYNMDQACARALALFEKQLSRASGA